MGERKPTTPGQLSNSVQNGTHLQRRCHYQHRYRAGVTNIGNLSTKRRRHVASSIPTTTARTIMCYFIRPNIASAVSARQPARQPMVHNILSAGITGNTTVTTWPYHTNDRLPGRNDSQSFLKRLVVLNRVPRILLWRWCGRPVSLKNY